MEYPNQTEPTTIEDTVESLARTVAHLALQLTVSQIQLRALGTVLAESGSVVADRVLAVTAQMAEQHAPGFLRENLGPDLTDLIDVIDLERQIVDFLSQRSE